MNSEKHSKLYTLNEIKKHDNEKDCWLIINQRVYNVTDFLSEHPGGKKVILNYGGKDATKEFEMLHRPNIIDKYGNEYLIGTSQHLAKL